MVYSITYRRPRYNSSTRASLNGHEKAGSIGGSTLESQSSCVSNGIPEPLSFDNIIKGGTCPPCTTRDFMNYLIHVEHAAENLQFFLWLKDYQKRFSNLPDKEKVLAPMWVSEQAETILPTTQMTRETKQQVSVETEAIFKGTDFATPTAHVVEIKANPFFTPPKTPPEDHMSMAPSEPTWSDYESTLNGSCGMGKPHNKKTAGAFERAEVKWQPFTIQPFREEISRIITIYIAEDSPRQLNLSARERGALLHALADTTHPSAFAAVLRTVEWTLRHQAHPNFIRWTICNGNRPRVIFARGLGIAGILGGTLAAVLLTLSGASRAWRALSAIGFLVGVATLIAAWKGMCVVLHGMHHRHLRPWELFMENDSASANTHQMTKDSLDSLGSATSYEDAPWVVKYQRRNIIRKIFDREVWIQEPALRQIQDTIFLQAIGGALVVTAIAMAIFACIPKGNFY